jgi:serine/threonine-protein kinase
MAEIQGGVENPTPSLIHKLADAAPPGPPRPPISPVRRNAVLGAAALLLAALAAWAYFGVRDSLRQIRAAELATVLDAEAKALQLWIDQQRKDAARWAAEPRVRAAVGRLAALSEEHRSPGDALWDAPERAALFELLQPFLGESGAATVNVVSRGGAVLLSRYRDYTGARLSPEANRLLAPVLAGETRFLRPLREAERVLASPSSAFDRPVLWAAAPVRGSDGQVIATLGFARYADEEFARILSVARPGATGEAYAFDPTGTMLSQSRFADELKAAGLLPADARGGAILNVRVRDPGGELARGHRPELTPEAWPLTRLAAEAIAARPRTDPAALRGVILDPYRNYRGARVIGAWAWLPDYDLGVAVEVGAREAYAPLTYLLVLFGVAFGLLVLAVPAALLSSFSVLRLKRQVGEARRLGPYTLEREIGEGGMSRVYLAQHALLKRPTAVKMLKPSIATDEMIARFEREVQLASQLSHPNTIEIYDYGRTRDGVFFYAMEYLDGITLEELVNRGGPVPATRVIAILRQLCGSLREAHNRGLIHRDIKPQNVMLCERGGEYDVVKVLDFGLVKDLDRPDPRDITQFMKVLGTPVYMAPERIRNPADADVRADIYSVGALAYYLLTGRKVFEAQTDLDLTNQVLNAPPPRPSENTTQEIPEELDILVVRCLAKSPAERPQRMEDLLVVIYVLSAWYPWSQTKATDWWEAHRAQPAAAAPGQPPGVTPSRK